MQRNLEDDQGFTVQRCWNEAAVEEQNRVQGGFCEIALGWIFGTLGGATGAGSYPPPRTRRRQDTLHHRQDCPT